MWFVLMLLVMLAIFAFSHQRDEQSRQLSNAVAESIHIESNSPWVQPSDKPILFGLHLRKWAHIALFSALGLAAMGWQRCWWKTGIICYAYAVFDEVHQYFVGRHAAFADTLIDALGFAAAILTWLLIENFYGKKSHGTKKR